MEVHVMCTSQTVLSSLLVLFINAAQCVTECVFRDFSELWRAAQMLDLRCEACTFTIPPLSL